jgi:hypothetical protein
LTLTRWFGDIGAQLIYRRGGDVHYAGLEFSIPLTPRSAYVTESVSIAGTSRFTAGVRTRIATGSTGVNALRFGAVRDFVPAYSLKTRFLNSGRWSEAYFVRELPRMRDAFFKYGFPQLQ